MAPQCVVFMSDSQRHWTHARPIDAYYTQESFESLQTVDDIPCLQGVEVPRNRYVCARNNGGRRKERQGATEPLLPPFSYDSSSSPSSSPETFYSAPYSHQSSPSHSLIPPAAPLPSGFILSDRRLAPLEYLQNISPRARDPIDDEALRQFQAISI